MNRITKLLRFMLFIVIAIIAFPIALLITIFLIAREEAVMLIANFEELEYNDAQ